MMPPSTACSEAGSTSEAFNNTPSRRIFTRRIFTRFWLPLWQCGDVLLKFSQLKDCLLQVAELAPNLFKSFKNDLFRKLSVMLRNTILNVWLIFLALDSNHRSSKWPQGQQLSTHWLTYLGSRAIYFLIKLRFASRTELLHVRFLPVSLFVVWNATFHLHLNFLRLQIPSFSFPGTNSWTIYCNFLSSVFRW